MSLEPAELLERVASTIRNDIAPAIDEEYPKTQAFMASVILQRLAKQVALGPGHAAAEAADIAALSNQLEPLLREAPAAVTDAAAGADAAGQVAALGPLIQALYAWGVDEGAGAGTGAAALAAVRGVLRRDIDRRMEIAQ